MPAANPGYFQLMRPDTKPDLLSYPMQFCFNDRAIEIRDHATLGASKVVMVRMIIIAKLKQSVPAQTHFLNQSKLPEQINTPVNGDCIHTIVFRLGN
jgi:hypothetical protein